MAPAPEIVIRDAVPGDGPALAAAEAATAAAPGLLVSRPHELLDPDLFRRSIEARAREGRGRYVVALRGGALAGHALLDPMGLEAVAHIVRLTIVVHPGFRGAGVGRALMDHLIAWARAAAGVEKIELNVRAGNAPAIALYRSCGFEEEGRLRGRVRLPDGRYEDDICMALWVKAGPSGRIAAP